MAIHVENGVDGASWRRGNIWVVEPDSWAAPGRLQASGAGVEGLMMMMNEAGRATDGGVAVRAGSSGRSDWRWATGG